MINPATGELLEHVEPHNEAEIEAKVAASAKAFETHRRSSLKHRCRNLLETSAILTSEKQRIALIMTTEMGKTLKSAAEEVEKCAWACRYYAETAETLLADETIEGSAPLSYIRYEPLGPILAIMPWNFPFWQVFRFAAPALAAGNTALLKHAPNVPRCAMAIEDIFRRAGFSEGVFQTLLIPADLVNTLLEDSRIVAATLTGSVEAGRSVANKAGQQLKKVVLELGGSDPFIVMASTDVEKAAKIAVRSRTINNGQSCIAAKRFIIAEPVYAQFVDCFVQNMRQLKVGNPLDEQTDIGPLATKKIRATLAAQVGRAVREGARVLTGGTEIAGAGSYYPPTVLTNVSRESSVFKEEIFGPVAMLFCVANANEAIALANDSPFGLGAGVWTNDAEEQELFIRELETGQVFINAMVASDPRLPFGGIKQSGYGRELGSIGIREFLNIKTVVRA